MKVWIISEELWPIYTAMREEKHAYGGGVEAEVDEETLDRWREVSRAFATYQLEIEAVVDAVNAKGTVT